MTPPRTLLLAAFGLAALSGCGAVFPRYTSATRRPPQGFIEANRLAAPPESVRRVTFVSAALPPQRSDGRAWDDDSPPDLTVRLYRNDVEVYRSPIARDQARAVWADAITTLYLPASAQMRVELWDDDGAFSDPVGRAEFRGIPTGAADGGDHLMRLEGGAELTLRVEAPAPMLGMGVTYEVHGDYLRVLEVDAVSPANTAGLRPDDRITAIDGQRISAIGEIGARQGMDRGAMRAVTVTVVRGDASPQDLEVRVDAVYPAR